MENRALCGIFDWYDTVVGVAGLHRREHVGNGGNRAVVHARPEIFERRLLRECRAGAEVGHEQFLLRGNRSRYDFAVYGFQRVFGYSAPVFVGEILENERFPPGGVDGFPVFGFHRPDFLCAGNSAGEQIQYLAVYLVYFYPYCVFVHPDSYVKFFRRRQSALQILPPTLRSRHPRTGKRPRPRGLLLPA